MRVLNSCLLLFTVISSVHAETGSYADYLWLTETCDGFFTDSMVMNGPVRMNTAFFIVSNTPGRDHDPWFYSLTSAGDSIYTFLADTSIVISSTVPHPEGSNLWVEPYEQMVQGPPWFNLGADPIPFGYENVDWQTTRDAAMTLGYYFPPDSLESGTRIILTASRLEIKENPEAEEIRICVFEVPEPVIWIDNAPEDTIYVRSVLPDTGIAVFTPMTIGCNGHLFIMGDIEYEPGYSGMLGLITTSGDMEIADTPLEEPWQGEWKIDTERDMVISGSFLLCDGWFSAENPWEPHPAVDFTIFGGIQMIQEGITGYWTPYSGNSWGYFLNFDFDTRFFTQSPPFYPAFDTGTGIGGGPAAPAEDRLLAVMGNPFHGTLDIRLVTTADEPLKLYLLDISGRVVLQSLITDERSLPTEGLPSGTYMLVLESPRGHTESL
ncbi:MAG: T9SS type A sorting domain-containing protein, partial [Candidatus Fermentibacteraceae bacterium]|nr:T9SS type A sorting domain-containing protein [Candidatus Fermentibacteraceae bacterium]